MYVRPSCNISSLICMKEGLQRSSFDCVVNQAFPPSLNKNVRPGVPAPTLSSQSANMELGPDKPCMVLWALTNSVLALWTLWEIYMYVGCSSFYFTQSFEGLHSARAQLANGPALAAAAARNPVLRWMRGEPGSGLTLRRLPMKMGYLDLPKGLS